MPWASLNRSRRTFLAQASSLAALSAWGPHVAFAASTANPQPAELGAVHAGNSSDLGVRTSLNFTRLQSDIYRPPQVFRGTNWKSWPGDMEGRALLALTLLSQATGSPPAYLADMVAAYKPQLNEKGYFGPLLDLHAINEQQLSGHGWYLRALCEYATYKPADSETLQHIQGIVTNLALPLKGKYTAYPIDPAAHARVGGEAGSSTGQHGDWVLSTDTGCAFIFLDGLTQAWVLLRSPALKALIDEAIDTFLAIDLIAIKAQTHATLTMLRAMLRVYDKTGDPDLLNAVRDRYELYRTSAMTDHYANTNWFGRPDSWTEPCAILDSYIVATQLWQFTADESYLEDAHHIWFNGVGRGLRHNGGFGTDTCPGFTSPTVKVRSYEAYFCCTMRGGEGHARAIQYLYFTRANEQGPADLILPFYSDSEAHLDLGHTPGEYLLNLKQTTAYPYSGSVFLEVIAATFATPAPMTLRLFAPQWTSNHKLSLNGEPLATTLANGFLSAKFTPKTGDVLRLDQTLRVEARDGMHPKNLPGYYAFEAGPLILGYKPTDAAAAEIHIPRSAALAASTAGGTYRIAATKTAPEITLSPINDLVSLAADQKDPCPRQILFRTT